MSLVPLLHFRCSCWTLAGSEYGYNTVALRLLVILSFFPGTLDHIIRRLKGNIESFELCSSVVHLLISAPLFNDLNAANKCRTVIMKPWFLSTKQSQSDEFQVINDNERWEWISGSRDGNKQKSKINEKRQEREVKTWRKRWRENRNGRLLASVYFQPSLEMNFTSKYGEGAFWNISESTEIFSVFQGIIQSTILRVKWRDVRPQLKAASWQKEGTL